MSASSPWRWGTALLLLVLLPLTFVPPALAAEAPVYTALTLQEQVKKWRSSKLDNVSLRQFQDVIPQAQEMAEENGLDVDKLTAIWEAAKKLIRNASFLNPNQMPPDESSLWSWIPAGQDSLVGSSQAEHEMSVAEYRARQQDIKLFFYKRVTAAYLDALLSSTEKPPECRPSPDTVHDEVEIEGKTIPVVGCPDPVVKRFRAYVDAIRSIQSADQDILVADLEMMIAQQQLAIDLMSGFPLVGEALDVYSIYSGENLAGVAVGPTERVFTIVMLAVPILGPKAFDVLKVVFKRSDEAADGARILSEALDASTSSRAWLDEAYPGMASDLAQEAGKRLDGTVDELDKVRQMLAKALADAPDPPEGSEAFMLQKLREAMMDKAAIEAMEPAVRERALREAMQVFGEGLGAYQSAVTRAGRIRASGMVATHAEAFVHVAGKRDEIFLVRDVNPAATRLIALDASTKGMGVKAKSASHGIIAGSIPVDPDLNKLGSRLRDTRAKIASGNVDSSTLAALEREAAELQHAVDEGRKVIEKCRTSKCAVEIPFTLPDGKVVHQAKAPGSGNPVYVIQDDAGRWVDADTGKRLGFDPGSPPEVKVLGDPETGKMLTADYDMLNFGKKGEHAAPSYSGETGFITPGQQDAIGDLNATIQGRDPGFDPTSHGGKPYEGGNVVHHGGEENFFKSPGIDGDAITAFEPNGNVISIPKCDPDCMKVWCMGRSSSGGRRCDPSKICRKLQKSNCIPVDGDRLFKDYFHLKRIEGWNLDPNPRWDWGDYNPLGGWIETLQCPTCAEAL